MKYARLFRPMPPEFFPSPTIVASLDEGRNIVFINKTLFEPLTDDQKSRVYNISDSYIELEPAEFSFR